MSNTSIIEKIVFEIEFSYNEKSNEEIMLKLKNRLLNELEKTMQLYSVNDLVHRFQEIKLPIIQLNSPFYEEEFGREFSKLISDKLSNLFIPNQSTLYERKGQNENKKYTISLTSAKYRNRELLLYYFEYGILPWWISDKEVISIKEMLSNELKSDTLNFGTLIFKLKDKLNAQRRFLNAMEEDFFIANLSEYFNLTINVFLNFRIDVVQYLNHFSFNMDNKWFNCLLLSFIAVNNKWSANVNKLFKNTDLIDDSILNQWVLNSNNFYRLFLEFVLQKTAYSSGTIVKKENSRKVIYDKIANDKYKMDEFDTAFTTDKNNIIEFNQESNSVIDLIIEHINSRLFQSGNNEKLHLGYAVQIEHLIIENHALYRNEMERYFNSITEVVYLIVAFRIETNFSQQVATILTKYYFNETIFNKSLEKFNQINDFENYLFQSKIQLSVLEKSLFSVFIKKYKITGASTKSIYTANSIEDKNSSDFEVPTYIVGLNTKEDYLFLFHFYCIHDRLPLNFSLDIECLVNEFIEKYPKLSIEYFKYNIRNSSKLHSFFSKHNYIIENAVNNKEENVNFTEKNKELVLVKNNDLELENYYYKSIYVSNAGLILIYPFLSGLFTKTNLMEKGKFIDLKSQIKAVYMLQYLVDKSMYSEEHSLVLNKMLCGLEINTAFYFDCFITETEILYCNELLQSVIEHWKILKNTSIDNFRVSFLQRKGKILLNESNAELYVETKGYDVLLEKLPWSIQIIKLSWMKKMLLVNWNYYI